MRLPLLAGIATVAFLAAPAYAGGSHHPHGYYDGHRYHSGYRNHRFGHRRYGYHHGYRQRHHSDRKYGYLAAGLLLGAVVGEVLHHRRQPERVVVDRRPVYRERVYAPAPVERVPSYEYDVYYRVEPDGSCWLVERRPDGSETVSRQPDGDC